ncbi:urease accessory protein UreE [Shimia abyssi]|uniref:Urease accessory protein UreE n=1 Tax=Shimia abyssi TaxID=1662395 RepID=A0A2P8FHL7_9RHOB|nr:urease accessory protein UreE [Shimia abyssi]PSL21197.1 urease accessory protein [Shimia abyssi]
MTALPTAHRYHDHAHAPASGTVSLSYEERFLRRKMLCTADGERFLVDLPQTTSLDHGGVLVLTDGREIAVNAAPEPLLQITAHELTRIAWHVGNRHTPCQIEADRLLIQPDHVIRDMLNLLGATVTDVTEPFTPEGGAYGHGRTHGHDHSHPHAHDHAH